MRKLLIAAALLLVAGPVLAQTVPPQRVEWRDVIKVAVGANGIWFDDNAKPSDFELGGNIAASLSPHVAVVGSTYYGFDHSYVRGATGFRITSSNVEDPNFSVGLGMQYNFSSENDIRPQEWTPDASLGFRPWPEEMPNVILIAQGSYGLDSNRAYVIAGVRYKLDLWGAQ